MKTQIRSGSDKVLVCPTFCRRKNIAQIEMLVKQIIKGSLTYVPGLYKLLRQKKMGGSTSAQYCYEVWIKHLTFLNHSGLNGVPGSVAELGPGDTIGVGLCALLSGSDKYTGLDVYPFSSVEENLKCLDILVGLFESRAPCPGPSWPDYQEYLDEYSFPSHILTDEVLNKALQPSRIRQIRNQIEVAGDATNGIDGSGPTISYIVPWNEKKVMRPESVDLIVSHSVLEHVADIQGTISACDSWLRPGGWMSHQIDFTSHGQTENWNGHWAISDFTWRLIIGRRQFLINREPISNIEEALANHDFQVEFSVRRNKPKSIDRTQLAPRFVGLSDDDFCCAEALIQTSKKS